MNARVVAATEEDLAAISRLAAGIWRAHYPGIISVEQIDYMLSKMYSLDKLREEVRARGIGYYRLLAGDEFAGFAACGIFDEQDSSGSDGNAFKLHKLYVHPKWHGNGFGALLLQHCERQSRDAGARRLVLAVNKRNSKAIGFYQRHGFAIARSIIEDIGGGFFMDDYVMEKNLIS